MTKPSLVLLALALAFLLSMGSSAHAVCFTTEVPASSGAPPAPSFNICWNSVNPIPGTFDLEGVTRGNDEYLAVGAGGVILTSPDGGVWTPRDSGTTQRLYNAIWTGSQYVVVGEGGLVLTSPDASQWTARVTNTRLALFDVAWNGEIYVAVGQNGTLITSPDTVEWTARNISISSSGTIGGATQPTLRAVAWGGVGSNSGFVAVGTSETIISSGNGTNWRVNNFSSNPTRPVLRDVAVNPTGLFIAVGVGAAFSSQGISEDPWPPMPIPPEYSNAVLNGITWIGSGAGNSRFIAVGSSGVGNEIESLALTTQGTQFDGSPALSGRDAVLNGVAAAANGDVVTVADRLILRADVNLNWSDITSPLAMSRNLRDIDYLALPGGPLYVAAGAEHTLLGSSNGLEWAPIELDPGNPPVGLNAVAWNGDAALPLIVAVGDVGRVLLSDDGEDWTLLPEPVADGHLFDVTYGDRFVAVGQAGTVLTSSDGAIWSPSDSGLDVDDLQGIAWNGSVYVAVGGEGRIISSSEGVQWTTRASGTDARLMAVAWNEDQERFVAAGVLGGVQEPSQGVLLSSGDGIDWTVLSGNAVPSDLGGVLALARGNGQFIAATDTGRFARSTDGTSWTMLGARVAGDTQPGSTTAPEPIRALAWDGARFVAAGDAGTILNSGGIDMLISLDASEIENPPEFAPANQLKTFRFNIANIGNLDARQIVFRYTLPASFLFADPPIVGAGLVCQALGETVAQCTINLSLAGTGEGVPITVNVVPQEEGPAESVAIIEVPGDSDPGNNELAFVTAVGPRQTPGLPSPDTEFEGGALDPWLLLALGLGLLLALHRRRPLSA